MIFFVNIHETRVYNSKKFKYKFKIHIFTDRATPFPLNFITEIHCDTGDGKERVGSLGQPSGNPLLMPTIKYEPWERKPDTTLHRKATT